MRAVTSVGIIVHGDREKQTGESEGWRSGRKGECMQTWIEINREKARVRDR